MLQRTLIYLFVVFPTIVLFMFVSGSIFENLETFQNSFIISGITLGFIFLFKFAFNEFTRQLQEKNSDVWVNAAMISFAAKFILIISFLFALSRLYKENSKELILWTAVLYCFLLIPDTIFALRAGRKQEKGAQNN